MDPRIGHGPTVWTGPFSWLVGLERDWDLLFGLGQVFLNSINKNNMIFIFIQLMAEILHQLIGSLSHYLQGLINPRWLFGISSINSMSIEIITCTKYNFSILGCKNNMIHIHMIFFDDIHRRYNTSYSYFIILFQKWTNPPLYRWFGFDSCLLQIHLFFKDI